MKLVRPWLVSSITYSLAIYSTILLWLHHLEVWGRVVSVVEVYIFLYNKLCGVVWKGKREKKSDREKKNYSNDDHNG